jgi:hypothetical protein
MDTTAAIIRGKERSTLAERRSVARSLAAAVDVDPASDAAGLPTTGPIGRWEDQARIDLRVLARQGLLRIDRFTHAVLDWSEEGVHPVRVDLMIDLCDRAEPSMTLACSTTDGQRLQRIWLHLPDRPGARWQMLCPVMGEYCEVVAWRDGRFASRQGQRLVNRSQRTAKAARA